MTTDGTRSGVVRGKRDNGAELVGELSKISHAGIDVVASIEGIGNTEVQLRTRHQLHQALRADAGHRVPTMRGLDGDDRVNERRVDAMTRGGRGDLCSEGKNDRLGRRIGGKHQQNGNE